MRGLLLLGAVGAILYGSLLLADNVLPDRGTGDFMAGKIQPPRSDARTLRSWGSNLPALVLQPRELTSRHSEPISAADQVAVSGEKPATVTTPKPPQIEWARVTLAARAHREPIVSSPTIGFYSSGTELQVVRRQSGWVELADPVTHKRGWVFEGYLAAIEQPTRGQIAGGSPIEEELLKSPPSSLSSKPRSRSAEAAPVVSDKFIRKSDLRRGRWVIRDERRRRFGLFRRRVATFEAAR
jgi:hypothetical protein